MKWCPNFDRSPLHQVSKYNISFGYVDFLVDKSLSNSVSPYENSTTRITITEDAESSDTIPSPKILLQKAPTDKGIQYLG